MFPSTAALSGDNAATARLTEATATTPKRIVSLSLASDEILLDLMPNCGGVSRIAGLSTFADDPTASSVTEAAKAVRGRVHSEPESLFSLKPDLIIAASFNRPELLRMIRSRKVPSITLDKFATVQDISTHILSIGTATGCEPQAQRMSQEFIATTAPTQTPQREVKVINYSEDLSIMGKDTLFDELVARAGAKNAASEHGLRFWPRVNSETLLAMNPDHVIVIGQDTPKIRSSMKSHAVWSRLSAVRQDHLIFLNPATSLSTSHYFGHAIKELRQKLAELPRQKK